MQACPLSTATNRIPFPNPGPPSSSPQLLSICKAHQAADAQRMEAHWQEVQRKQAPVKELRAELQRLESQVSCCQSALSSAVYARDRNSCRSHGWRMADAEVDAAQTRLSIADSERGRVESGLKSELKAPPPVVQPLPEGEGAALRWLFILHMGEVAPHLRCLARAAFAAQHLLLWPCSSEAKERLAVKRYKTGLVQVRRSARPRRVRGRESMCWDSAPSTPGGIVQSLDMRSFCLLYLPCRPPNPLPCPALQLLPAEQLRQHPPAALWLGRRHLLGVAADAPRAQQHRAPGRGWHVQPPRRRVVARPAGP